MALAFTVFVALDPADENMAVNVYDFNDDFVNPDQVTSTTDWSEVGEEYKGLFYVSEDTTVKMKGKATVEPNAYVFYVQNGVALTLDFKSGWDSTQPIQIFTVTGDQQVYLTSDLGSGKVVLAKTKADFIGEAGMSVYYQAAEVTFDVDYNRLAENGGTFIKTVAPEIDTKAYFSADAKFTGNAAPVFGTDVAVAPGQTIESKDAVTTATLEFGAVIYEKGSGSVTDTYTYYSIGADIGDYVLSGENTVQVLDAKVTVKDSASSVKINKVKENDGDKTGTKVAYDNTNNLELSVSDVFGGATYGMMAGSITVNGNVKFTSYNFDDGTVTVANKTNIAASSSITVGGTLVLKNESAAGLEVLGTGTLEVTNDKIWNSTPTTGLDVDIDTFHGLVDTSAISEVARVEKKISTSYIEIDQTFELFGDTTVSTNMTVRGILIVDEGVTLTIDKGASISMIAPNTGTINGCNFAQIINYGTIVVKADVFGQGLFIQSGKLFNYGTISMASKSSLSGDAATSTLFSEGLGIKNAGNITVSKSDYVYLKEFENTVTGKINVNGKFKGDSVINNKGSIVFNGATIGEDGTDDATVTINMKGADAQFYISSVALYDEDNYILVKDDGYSYYDDDNVIHTGSSGVFVGYTTSTITKGSTIRGLTVGETVDSDDNPQMTIGGGVTINSSKKQVDIGLLALGTADDGNFLVAGNFTVPAYVKLGTYKYLVSNPGIPVAPDSSDATVKITVTGEMTFNKDAIEMGENDKYAVTNLYVDGSINSKDGNKLGYAHYVAAMVENDDGDYLYMPIEDAVAYAIIEDLNLVTVGYVNTGSGDADYVTVTKDIAIPAELTVQTVDKYNLAGETLDAAAVPKI
jgi:hypothetical protein